MSILVIRQHSRFAVCRKARVRREAARMAAGALLIELSVEGCRLSGLGNRAYALDETVELKIEGADPLHARVRWVRDGTLGLRFDRALSFAALDRLIRLCRDGMAPERDRAIAG